jgi:alkylation response protein AidB-like acyl-CoA dehydrogenase
MSDIGDELAATVRRLLDDKAPRSSVRSVVDQGASAPADAWRALKDIGLPALAIPEEFGGDGAGWENLVRVFEEMGRSLYPGPFFGSVGLALPCLLACGTQQVRRDLLPRVAGGDAVLAYAIGESDRASWNLADVRCAATTSTDADAGWRLDGRKDFVIGAEAADYLLVVARVGAGLGVFVVDVSAEGLAIQTRPSIDLTRPVSAVTVHHTPAQLISNDGTSLSDLERALDVSRLAVAADALGAAQACLDMATGYARERFQFGRAIGSFQAIKHLCADLLLAVEGARSAVYAAGAVLDSGSADAGAYACLAKAVAADVLRKASADNIQIHGALGFTWEHDAHLFYRRGIADELLLGNSIYHRERLAALLGV